MTYQKTIADLGAGEAKQTLRLARSNPENSYYAIEPNQSSYSDTEKKASKKESKGGVQNIKFINSSIEQITDELFDTFDEIQVNFPWGSLLEGVIIPTEDVIENIVKIAKDGCKLIITTTYDDKFEKDFKTERNLPEISFQYIDENLRKSYEAFGIEIEMIKVLSSLEKKEIDSPWGKKILSTRDREVYTIEAIINKN